MLEELQKLEPSFTESMFKTKVDNIFISLLNAIMFQDIERVSSSLGENLREEITAKIETLKSSNEIQMYDELNVKHTEITRVQILEDCYQIQVTLTSRYMDYRLDNQTKKLKSGDNSRRVEKQNYLVFEEKRNHKSLGDSIKCPYCGAPIDYNKTGICEYCKQQMPKEDYDWVLVSWRETL